jgi:GT2 family glycosyltransferase
LIAGRVLQPWDVAGGSGRNPTSTFARSEPGIVEEFMGGNFSVRRDDALAIGGFDENFVQVAYRFEAEFASRFRAQGGVIRFVPEACLHHLRVKAGGTRAYGDHLTTMKPAHAVGAYYFSIRTRTLGQCLLDCVTRLFRAVATRHHLRKPWWIPATLSAELRGLWWAIRLHGGGPRLIGTVRHGS